MIGEIGEGAKKPDRSDIPTEVAKFTDILDTLVNSALEEMEEGAVISPTSMATAMILFSSDFLGALEEILPEGSEERKTLADGNNRMRVGYTAFLLREAMVLLSKEKKCLQEDDDCEDCPFLNACRLHGERHPESKVPATSAEVEAIKERIGRMF